jgi:radical SAM superfamily enzyme YgiQ (UPF0313 family)
MLPKEWEKKAIDMNIDRLTDKDIKWADYVFVSAMVAQQKSAMEVVRRCKKLETKVVAGGPYFTTGYGHFDFSEIDHVILDEGEITLPLFLEDLRRGTPQPTYRTTEKAVITESPTPVFSMVNLNKYAQVCVQYSRGCPFNCEFCDIIILDGHVPRTKTKQQMLTEFEAIYDTGYRGSVFVVDDNFISNKKKLKGEILPAIIKWQKEREFPFRLLTEASINLADDDDLLQLMSDAGFSKVFVGIESPNEESLAECNKFMNKKRDLVASVKKIQNYGFEVMGGFIVGFDNDPISIFKSQINFIQKSGIVTAMVGILNAPPQTRLWHRLKQENRILPGGHGDNTDGTTNFIPKMRFDVLMNGYKHIVDTIYAPKQYYERIHTFLSEYRPNVNARRKFKLEGHHIRSFVKSSFVLGIKDSSRIQYWKLFFSTLRKYPRLIGLSISLAVQGLHFRKIYQNVKDIQIDEALLARQTKVLNGEQL